MSNDEAPQLVEVEDVEVLAKVADLPLAEGRAELIAPALNAWVVGANELNDKMMRPEHWAIIPASVFTHPEGEEGRES